jgi:hypothetical protein
MIGSFHIARGMAWLGPFAVPLLGHEEQLLKALIGGTVTVDQVRFHFAGDGWRGVVERLNRQLDPLGIAVVLDDLDLELAAR